MSGASKPAAESNLALSRATIGDVPNLCRAFNPSFTQLMYQSTFPWSAEFEKWWYKVYVSAILKDAQSTHIMRVVNTNANRRLMAFARWVMPAGTSSGLLAEDHRWPKYSKDFDAGHCDAMLGTFGKMRKKYMGDQPHSCK